MPTSAPAKIRVPFPQTPTTYVSMDAHEGAISDGEAEGIRRTLQKGYQSLALIAIILSVVEAQVLTFTLTDGDGTSASYQAINSLMLVATMLSMSGAITATLSMRWYSIVPKDSVQLLAHRRSYDQGQVREDLAPLRFRETIFERTIPFALNTCIHLTNAGFLIFVAGILTYAWIRQETPVAIVTTVSAGCGLFCMSLFYLPFEFRYVIHHLHFMRFQFWPPPATRRERRSALQSPREETSKASASV